LGQADSGKISVAGWRENSEEENAKNERRKSEERRTKSGRVQAFSAVNLGSTYASKE
jgi:hypothetical protein